MGIIIEALARAQLIDGLLVKNWVEKENNKVVENLKKALKA